jgi:DUF4097 and DUF4098 domain-containing protein YvlB
MRTHRFDTPGSVDLEIDIKSGRVHAETYDGNETVVELDSSDSALVDEVSVDCEPVGEGHRIVIRMPRMGEHSFLRLFNRSSVDVHVRVPQQALADISTSSGEIRLDGNYREVRATTASGEVRVGNVTGLVSINTASGDITVESVGGRATIRTASADVQCGPIGGGADIKTASGDVRVESVTDRIAVTSGSGDIELGGTDSCKLHTASGDLRVGGIRQGTADLKTASGDIDIAVVAGAIVAVDAESVTGDLSSEIELFDSEPAATDETDNDREIELILRTVSGDIQVRRTPAHAAS